MTGKISTLRGLAPESVVPKQVVSYETSNMFGQLVQERYNPDELVSRKGIYIYKRMMDDEQVKAVMTFRRSSIIARGFEFKYADDSPLSVEERERRIKFFQFNVDNIRGSFQDGLIAILRGHQFGFSMTEKVYDDLEFEGRPMLGIAQLLSRDPAWFRFFTDKYGTLTKCEQCIGNEKVQIDIGKFIHYVRAPEEDRYYGQSDLKSAYRAWYIKDVVVKLYAIYLERFAGGFAYAELPKESNLAAGHVEYEALKVALENIRNLASLILPAGVELNVFQPASTAEYREALTYFDLGVAKAILVPNLLGLSHTGQTGAYSQSQTQLEAYFMTTASDTSRVEDTINEQLFKDLGDLNFGDGQYPRFTFKPASAEHVKWLITTFKELTGAGAVMPTEADEAHLRKLLDMPARTEEDGLLKETSLELEKKFAPPEKVPFTLDQLNTTLRERDERLLLSMREAFLLSGPAPASDRSTRSSKQGHTDRASARFHYPGGQDHDQSTHGRGGGHGSLREWKDAGGARAMVASDEEAEALEEYIGDGYMGVNEELRGDNEVQPDGFYTETIQHLDAVIERSSLPEDVTLWRGVADAGGNFVNEIEADGVLYEPAYSSWTDNRAGASDFAGDGPTSGFYLRMSASKGQEGFLKLGGVEREYLGARGKSLYVLGITELQDGTKIVDVEVGE